MTGSLAMQRVLLTGATGFVGQAIARALVREGCRVMALVRNPQAAKILLPDDVAFFSCNLEDRGTVVELFPLADICIHLASVKFNYKVHTEQALMVAERNLEIHRNLIEGCRARGIPKVMFLSSVVVYEDLAHHLLTERSPVRFVDTPDGYAWSKLVMEGLFRFLTRETGIQSICVRADNTYGPGDSYAVQGMQVIPSIVRKAHQDNPLIIWGSGMQKRTFLYVNDLVRGLLALLGMERNIPEVINLSSSQVVTLMNVAQEVVRQTGREVEVVVDTDQPEGNAWRCMDNSLFLKTVGRDFLFTPLQEGLNATIRDFRTRFTEHDGLQI
ncbi:MAG: NAD-dependent epimerase/dehydratase family protein [Magnetococcales bacterium]|nr:NAD-dependent epimerase/dehydratase family protein [Magnetococcales bacterium]